MHLNDAPRSLPARAAFADEGREEGGAEREADNARMIDGREEADLVPRVLLLAIAESTSWNKLDDVRRLVHVPCHLPNLTKGAAAEHMVE